MELTRSELRASTLEWLDDPKGQKFNHDARFSRVDRLIHEAYQHIVNEIDKIPHAWNILPPADAITITIVAQQQEYGLGKIRKVIDVVEILNGEEHPVGTVSWADRNRAGQGVYLYRRSDGDRENLWMLGLVALPSSYTTLAVYALPLLKKLTGDLSNPSAVPEDFHELIYYRAAMLGLMSVNRDPGQVQKLYVEGLVEMRSKLRQRITGSQRAPRLNAASNRSRRYRP